MIEKYKFKRVHFQMDRLLVCPYCLETLFRDDIEHFGKCPYCDFEFEYNRDIEDFLLKPVVDRWLSFQDTPREEVARGDY